MATLRKDGLEGSGGSLNHKGNGTRQKLRNLERIHSTKSPSNYYGKNSDMDRFEKSDSQLEYVHSNMKRPLHRESSNKGISHSSHGPNKSKIRVNRPGVVRQTSKAALPKQNSKPAHASQDSNPALPRQSSRPSMARQESAPRPSVARQNSALRPKLIRENSKPPAVPIMTRQSSKPSLARQNSMPRGRPSLTNDASSKMRVERTHSRGDLQRTMSTPLVRTPSTSMPRPSIARTNSRGDMQEGGKAKTKGNKVGPTNGKAGALGVRNWKKFKKIEERPKRGLVVIWLVVLAELAFDLGTTIIAFQAMLQEDDCCGYELNLGPLPLTVATPFIFLISLELLILIRAVVLTLWPSVMDKMPLDGIDSEGKERSSLMKLACCCLRWNVKALLKAIHILVLLNPFFGCVIAWMLLYQSDKSESFLVLGLEGGSIILHFISVKLEGSVKTFKQFLFHCLPLIPFTISVGLVLVYLKQGGVCYIVENAVFQFQGCEVCPDAGNGTFPPVDGKCTLANGTVVSVGEGSLFDISKLDDIHSLTGKTSTQDQFCGDDHEGWSTNFCFFGYT